MLKAGKFLAKYPFVMVLLLSIGAIAALFVSGFYGASDDLHIAWLSQMDKILREGQIPPRFVPDLSYGFGYPLFNFVFPLPFYIAEIFHLLGFTLVDSIKILFGLSLPVSGYFMYKLVKEFSSPILATAAAAVYIYTPYRSTDIYVRGAIGEIVAFVFLPLIVLSIVKVTNPKVQNRGWAGILGISTAFLIMSHNIMSYMFFPFLLLLIVLRVLQVSKLYRLKAFLKVSAGLFLGLFISIYFWLPALLESTLMKESTVFDFKDHFPTLKQLITPYFGYGASVPGPYDGMSFFIGVINLLLILVAVFIFIKWRKKLNKDQIVLSIWVFLVLLVSVFLMNYRSIFVWEKLPLIPYFQFPWRFLSMTTFVTPIFIILLTKFKYSKPIGLLIIVASIILNFSYFRPHDFLGRTDEYYLNRYIPESSASDEYKQISEEYLRLPKATTVRPDALLPRVNLSGGEINDLKIENSLDASFKVDLKTPAVVSYNKYLFPGWIATVDQNKVILKAGQKYGQITFDLDRGKHSVEVMYRETNFRMLLNMISLLTLLLSIGIIFISKKTYENEKV